jgi:hypothetical protein
LAFIIRDSYYNCNTVRHLRKK